MASYTVKKGDTLSAIAKQYGVSYMDIAKANNIADPNKISIGQKLTIPGSTPSKTPSKTPTPTPGARDKYGSMSSSTPNKTPSPTPGARNKYGAMGSSTPTSTPGARDKYGSMNPTALADDLKPPRTEVEAEAPKPKPKPKPKTKVVVTLPDGTKTTGYINPTDNRTYYDKDFTKPLKTQGAKVTVIQGEKRKDYTRY